LRAERSAEKTLIGQWDYSGSCKQALVAKKRNYGKMAFSSANVSAHTVQIANEMLANVEGNFTINVDF
jgi:hypothetical protein